MSSTKKSKFGADKCVDGDLDTVSLIRFAQFFNCFILLCDQLGVHQVCTTKRKRYSTITLDFGEPVAMSKVIDHCLLGQNDFIFWIKDSYFSTRST